MNDYTSMTGIKLYNSVLYSLTWFFNSNVCWNRPICWFVELFYSIVKIILIDWSHHKVFLWWVIKLDIKILNEKADLKTAIVSYTNIYQECFLAITTTSLRQIFLRNFHEYWTRCIKTAYISITLHILVIMAVAWHLGVK